MNSRGFAALRGVRGGDCGGEISMAISVFENAAASEGLRPSPPRRGEVEVARPILRRSPYPSTEAEAEAESRRGEGHRVVRGRGKLKRLRGSVDLDIWGKFGREN